MDTPTWWSTISGEEIFQGDVLLECRVPDLTKELSGDGQASSVSVLAADLIVISQTCDLVNMKSGAVALCPIRTLAEYELAFPTFAKKGVWEEVRKGRREGLYMLASPTAPNLARETLLVNFREIHSLPIGYLKRHATAMGPRWRLSSPFLEHFSQAFARFFMRVGLPSPLPPFTD